MEFVQIMFYEIYQIYGEVHFSTRVWPSFDVVDNSHSKMTRGESIILLSSFGHSLLEKRFPEIMLDW
jgi:hypothetical protein